MAYYVSFAGRDYLVTLKREGTQPLALVREVGAEQTHTLAVEPISNTSVLIAGTVINLAAQCPDTEHGFTRVALRCGLQSNTVELRLQSERSRKTDLSLTSGGRGAGWVRSPMPGRILDVFVEPGRAVTRGTPLLVIEAMKMENQLLAESDGQIQAVHVEAGATVEAGALLVEVG